MNVSYDIWGTLLKSNPEFKKQQLNLAIEYFHLDISYDDLKAKFNWAKKYYDAIVESDGVHINREYILKEIFKGHELYKIREFIRMSDELFIVNMPIKINEIREEHDSYITSNTVLTHGETLGKVISFYYDIPFKNMRFSDEIGVSKPHPLIFKHDVEIDYHVGDNMTTDGASIKLNIPFIHVDEYNLFFSQLVL